MKTEQELFELAKGIKEGRIFTSNHIPEEDSEMIGHVFMVIGLGGLAQMDPEEVKNIGFVYEELSKAGPRMINGYPMFMSMSIATVEEREKVNEFFNQLVKAEEDLLPKTPQTAPPRGEETSSKPPV